MRLERGIPDGVAGISDQEMSQRVTQFMPDGNSEAWGQQDSRASASRLQRVAQVPTSSTPPLQEHAIDDLVEYFSSKGKWIDAVVVRYNGDGTYDLDVRPQAVGTNIRKKVYQVGDDVVYVDSKHFVGAVFQGIPKKVVRVLEGDKYECSDSKSTDVYHVRDLRQPTAPLASPRTGSPPSMVPSVVLPQQAREPPSDARRLTTTPSAQESLGGQQNPRQSRITIATVPDRPERQTSAPVVPAAQEDEFEEGEVVQYLSLTFKQYVQATVKKVNDDGTIDLDCKSRAQRKKIRKIAKAATVEQDDKGKEQAGLATPRQRVDNEGSSASPLRADRSRVQVDSVKPAVSRVPSHPAISAVPAGYGGAPPRLPPPMPQRLPSSKRPAGEPRGKFSYGPLVGPRLNCTGPVFDPSGMVPELCRLLQMPAEEASIRAATGFKGGMNNGIWFLSSAARPTLVLKLVTSQRPHPSAATESENLRHLAATVPRLVKDLLVTFPVKLFSISQNGQSPIYDLLVMEAAEGKAAIDLFPQLYQKANPSNTAAVRKLLWHIGAAIKKLHRAYQNKQHGDMQPNNIFVDPETFKVTFIDIGGFGLSRPVGDVQHFQNSLKLLAGDGDVGYGSNFSQAGTPAFLAGYNGEALPA